MSKEMTKEQEDKEIMRIINHVRYIGEDENDKSCYVLKYKGEEWRSHCTLELAELAIAFDKTS